MVVNCSINGVGVQINAGEPEFETINGIPRFFTLYPNAAFEVELVTEYPDETVVYGVDFKLGYQMQMETGLGTYEAWQVLMQENSQKRDRFVDERTLSAY